VLSLGPSLVAPVLKKNPSIIPAVVARLQYTPPFGAAAAIVDYDVTAIYGFITLAVWILGLAALLIVLEKRAPQRQAAASVKMVWQSVFDQAGALFGPRIGPLVGHWLRFYLRNSRTRLMAFISLPLLAFITVRTSVQIGAARSLRRRPGNVSHGDIHVHVAHRCQSIRATSVERFDVICCSRSSLPISSARPATRRWHWEPWSLPIVLLAGSSVAPGPFDARMLVMLACSGITGLFAYNALGIWITLFNPRRGKIQQQLRQRSFSRRQHRRDRRRHQRILPAHGALPRLAGPRLAGILDDDPAAPLFAAAFYIGSLRAAGPIFTARREQLLAVVEGKA